MENLKLPLKFYEKTHSEVAYLKFHCKHSIKGIYPQITNRWVKEKRQDKCAEN